MQAGSRQLPVGFVSLALPLVNRRTSMSTVMWRTPLASSVTMPLWGTQADCWPSTCCTQKAREGRVDSEGGSGGGADRGAGGANDSCNDWR